MELICTLHSVTNDGPACPKHVGGIPNSSVFPTKNYVLCWSLLKNYIYKTAQ